MNKQKILIEETQHTKKIILNTPEKRNSLDEEMVYLLTENIQRISDDDNTRSVVITGAGNNFCSGLSLEYLKRISEFDVLQNKTDSHNLKKLLLTIYNCRKPTIAVVDGYALALGCGIATACDMIISSDKSQFGFTELKVGFIPALLMVFLLKRISESKAKELLLTPNFIDAEEAYKIGLVNSVVTQNKLGEFSEKLCSEINNLPLNTVMLTKEMFRNISSMSFEAGLEYASNMNTVTRMTTECKKGLTRFLSKNK